MSIRGQLLGWYTRLDRHALALWKQQSEMVDRRMFLQAIRADESDIADAQEWINEIANAAVYVQEYASDLYRRAQRPEYWQELAECNCTPRDDLACRGCVPALETDYDELPY